MTVARTYWGDDVASRTFDVMVDRRVIATRSLDRRRPGEFFEVEYPIPPEVTRGKDKVTARFAPPDGNLAGGVFECVVLR
jgi:hypothetical protein